MSIAICLLMVTSVAASITQNVGQLSSNGIIYVDDDNTSGIEDGSIMHPYNTIQEGVDAAVSGDTVYVFSGNYYENVNIFKSIVLEGEDRDRTIVDGGGISDVINITADNVTITGFKVTNSGSVDSYPIWDAGIDVRSNNNIIFNCNISQNNANAVTLYKSSYNIVFNNYVGSNTKAGIVILSDSKHNTIHNCTLVSNGLHGFWILYHSNSNIIEDNHISNNDHSGIILINSIYNVIHRNTISFNIEYGIYSAIHWATNNKIYNNNFISNTVQAYDEGKNEWDNGYPSGGNYWSDYTGDDIFLGPNQDQPGSDGIGDTPYPITGGDNQDNYPLINPIGTPPSLTVNVTSHFSELNSAAQSAITVHVTDGTNPVQGATVNLVSDNGGIFSPQSGITDASGDFKSIFNAPTVTSQIICRISAEVSKTGYSDGSGYVDVTINPIPWPMFRQNLNHTGVSPYDTSSNPGKLKWSFQMNSILLASPVIGSDGTIYIGTVIGNTLFTDNYLYAINPDGSEKWNFTTEFHIHSSPVIGSDDTIYFGAEDNKIYAINPDGTLKWSYTTGPYIMDWSSPIIGSDGTIYIGSEDNKLYAINPNGTLKWNKITGGRIDSSPAIGLDGTIYVGSHDHRLYAINPDSTERWSFSMGGQVRSSPTIGSDGTIYIGSDDDKLYAINPDGTEKWSYLTSHFVKSSPAIASDGTIYVGSLDGKLYALNPNSTEKWIFLVGPQVTSSPSIGLDGTIYIGSWDHKMYAINPDGTEKWSFITNGYLESSPAIGTDGTIYVGSWDGNLYAINEGGIPPIANAGPDQTVNEGSPIQLDASSSYDPDGLIESYEWDFESDGTYDYQETSTNAPDGTFDGITEHIYADNGVYTVTLRVTDNTGENDTDTCIVTVNNLAPSITPFGPFTVNEGSPFTPSATCTDPGSDDLTLTWELELGPTITRTFYNDGMGPDPNPSPWGNFPFTVSDSINHTYGDDGTYSVTLTVIDDDGDSETYSTSVTVDNLSPSGGISGIYFGEEGASISFMASGTDQGSDDLTFSWNWGDGTPDTVATYYNDGLNPDPLKSPDGIFPFSATDTIEHIYGDDAGYTVTLTITDDESYYVIYSTIVNVSNLAPTIATFILEPVDEGTPILIMTTATDPGSDDLTFTWDFEYGPSISNIYYNDGTGPDPDPSPQGTYPFSASDTVVHTYGDDGEFSVTLTVQDDDGGETSYTTTLEVNNVAPLLDLTGPSEVDENSLFGLDGHATDPGSDDLTFTWEFEFGPTIIKIYYNNGISSDPDPSPDVNSMDVLDNLAHTYGDNGVFSVTLTVTDDDGGIYTASIDVTVNNVLPQIDFNNPPDVNENTPVTVTAIVSDEGSDDLIITWDWGDGFSSTITTTYFNDGIGPDSNPSPDINPMSVMESQTHTYGDNGIFTVTLTALDDDNGETIATVDIEVKNVDPTIVDIQAYLYANISLRVAGEKYHSVTIRLYEDSFEIWADTITRYPGSPDEQKATISNIRLDMTKNYTALVEYIPNDPRVNGNVWGGNPVWIDMEFEDGSTERLHHTFNVRKSYWDSDHWNHIDPWEVDLKSNLMGHSIKVATHITDPGSDDEILTYSYGSQMKTVTYLNNPPNPDPYPSPEVNPVNIMDKTTLSYEGAGTVMLTVEDDDGGFCVVTLDIG